MTIMRDTTFQLAALIFWLFTAANGKSQTLGQSPAELINFLTYQSGRPGKLALMAGLTGCGHFEEDRSAARRLVELGSTAIPALERALRSLDEQGEESPFATNGSWLLEAYASISGLHAFPRLLEMMANPKLRFLEMSLDTSIAVSLSLTSYVSETRETVRIFACARSSGPSDALDQLVLGWLRNDRISLEKVLGPNGRSVLSQLLTGTAWADLRGQLGPRKPDRFVAVGYRFQDHSRWSQPGNIIEEEGSAAMSLLNGAAPELNVKFTDSSGTSCGNRSVRFLAEGPAEGEATKYVVDGSDLVDLLRVISSCATKPETSMLQWGRCNQMSADAWCSSHSRFQDL